MRIGIDMLGIQSTTSRRRGIGRYGRGLVSGLVAAGVADEFVLYAHDGLQTDDFPATPNVVIRQLPARPTRAESIESAAQGNPDGLDILLLTSPFEFKDGYAPPARPVDGPAMAAVIYDFVPFLFQERYLTWPPSARSFYANLERLRRYDVLLSISEATRVDGLRLLGLAPDRIANISGASEPDFFTPEPDGDLSAGDAELRRLGIDRPFVFCQASMDWRKNLFGLLDAFKLLPASTRGRHQLVLTFSLSDEDAATLRQEAETRRILHSLVITGEIQDETLRLLYRRCAAFAMPSFYEGLGLPLLEAMHCGAAVVGGNNSSQVEIVGDAGLLANAQDAADIANALGRILDEPGLADRLRAAAPSQAARFTWASTAERAHRALTQAVERQERRHRVRVDRPRLALVSPWPPKRSGIADYAVRLARALRTHYEIDLYHDHGYQPDLGREQHDYGIYHHRLFARNARVRGYRGVLYQMGNSHYHRFLYEMMGEHPGVVTLHDFGLGGFHWWYNKHGGAPAGHFDREALYCHPDVGEEVARSRVDWDAEEGGLADALAGRRLFMNRSLFERSDHVIIHAPWCIEQLRGLYPEYVGKTTVIPFGAEPCPTSPERRAELRRRFELPADGLIYGCFGYLHRFKLNVETIDAFARVADVRPDALLLFAGDELDRGAARRRAEERGLSGRVRFLGRQSDADFLALIAATDVGVCLRRPPTVGETSAALIDLLRHGVATVVSDVGTFADYPDDVVRKVRPEAGADGLARAFLDLADDREGIGRAALRHIEGQHGWAHVAERYAAAIEAHAVATGRRAGTAARLRAS